MRGIVAKRLRRIVPKLRGSTPEYHAIVHTKTVATPDGPKPRKTIQAVLAEDSPRLRYKLMKKFYKANPRFVQQSWPKGA